MPEQTTRRLRPERHLYAAAFLSKMNRERELREKRLLKQERKDEKKLAAAAAAAIEAGAPVDEPSDVPPA